jgi:uncharacterized protein (DUF302 family)
MVEVSKSKFELERTVELILEKATEAGWRVPAIHDLMQTLSSVGIAVDPVKVIELCSPTIAADLLISDDMRHYSALMPCRVSVFQNRLGETYISRLSVSAMSQMAESNVGVTMARAAADMEKIIAGLIE